MYPMLTEDTVLEIEQLSMDLARKSGRMLMERQHWPLTINYKDSHKTNPVTQADLDSQGMIIKGIRDYFPEHGLVAEEESLEDAVYNPTESPFLWVIDPLDGTLNFLNGLPLYGVSIGVLHKGQPIVGCIFVPWAGYTGGLVLHAHQGGGTYADEERINWEGLGILRPSQLGSVPAHYFNFFRFKGEFARNVREVRSLGSIAYEMAMTAKGVFQYSLFGRSRIWDVAAGVLLIQEAGGIVKVRLGRKWEPFHSFFQCKSSSEDLRAARSWSSPIIAGTPWVVNAATNGLTDQAWLGRRFGWGLK